MTAAEILARLDGAGIQIRAVGGRLIAAPRERLTDELRTKIRAHKAELVAALARGAQPEPARAEGPTKAPAKPKLAPTQRTDCMSCASLLMRCEQHDGTRRVFWWRCGKGYTLMEAHNFGERVLLAPPECDAAGDFRQWEPRIR